MVAGGGVTDRASPRERIPGLERIGNSVRTMRPPLVRIARRWLALSPTLLLLAFAVASLAVALLWPNEGTYDQPMYYFIVTSLFTFVAVLLLLLSRVARLPFFEIDPRKLRYPLILILLAAIASFTYLTFTSTTSGILIMYDGSAYIEMGRSFALAGEFQFQGVSSRHFPPLYPIYLSLFYRFDSGLATTQTAIEIMFLLSVAITFWATRDLYGNDWALLACALVFTVPSFLFPTSRNYGESLVLITFTLTIYAIMKSIRPGYRHYVVLAGLCAGLGYLSKSSVGYFFVIAGVIGLGWRYYYVRGAVLKDRYYLLAILIFVGIFSSWAYRNISLYWNGTPGGLIDAWQTSHWFRESAKRVLSEDPVAYMLAVLILSTFGTLFLSVFALAFRGPIRASLKMFRREEISGLWIAIVIPCLLSVLISAVFFVEESRYISIFHLHMRAFYHLSRYLFIVLVPMVWLCAATILPPRSASVGRTAGAEPEGRGRTVSSAGIGLPGSADLRSTSDPDLERFTPAKRPL